MNQRGTATTATTATATTNLGNLMCAKRYKNTKLENYCTRNEGDNLRENGMPKKWKQHNEIIETLLDVARLDR